MNLLAHQTRIAVQFVIEDDTQSVANFLAALTVLIGMLIGFARFISSVYLLVTDIVEATQFTLTLWGIGFRSLLYGLGVSI